MSDVVFENQGDEFGPPPARAKDFDLTGVLVRWGVAPDTAHAEYILIGLAIVGVAIGAFAWFYQGRSTSVTQAQVDAAMRGSGSSANSRF